MEALNFIRFLKPSNGGDRQNRAQSCRGNKNTTTNEVPKALNASDHELDQGDDSFFDLKLPLHGFESTNDNFSKRKILPIEPSSDLQSSTASLKSTPKFRFFTLSKSKSMATSSTSRTIVVEKAELIMESPEHGKQGSNKHFRVKFKIEDSPIFTRENSSRKGKTEDLLSFDSSKRLLKDLKQKYLNKFKPFYVKKSLREKIKVSVDLPVPSPVYSMKEKQTGGRGVCKKLGKSRSTSAASSCSSTISRRDDSLLLQHDGIQSAILHCKKSLNSSRETSRLSSCTSDSSQDKLSNASSTDSSLFSRVSSNSSYEKLMDSARISSQD